MAENENGQEKTEEASAKRKQEARDKGQIARSRELNTFLMLVASGIGLLFLGKGLVTDLEILLSDRLVIERADVFDAKSMLRLFMDSVHFGLNSVIPMLVLLVVVATLAPMALGGWSFSLTPLTPNLKKLDPIKGMARLLSLKGLMELFKALAKFFIVGAMGVWLLYDRLPGLMVLGNQSVEQGLARLGEDLMWVFLLLSSTLALVVLVDVPFQLWDHSRKQKMTKQEVKDEQKESEGNPEMKGKVRQTQREISQRRMMEAVPDADVVVTNPTHYAVALKYDQLSMAAPVVVALGVDEVAGHIRRIAEANDVPILSAPPLARALYHNSELDAEIPAGLFLAVAQVLAYVYQLRRYELDGGVAPEFAADAPIPDDLKRDD